MSSLDDAAEQQLAAMSETEVTELLARVRPPQEAADPMERAAQALRAMRGLDRRGSATKEQAAAAMRQYANGSRS
ncbi:hypothetical protein A5722_25530 [Mycobacterium vulneris]|nr:hypothetical protein A5722_25530 [Mycolicibacterium vulneris]OCB63971.1 hypothetical protein A5729_22850 [Mycolicibacterium vulneris]